MDVEHRLELLVGHVVDAPIPRVPGVVHHDVEAVEFGECRGDELVARPRGDEVSDVGGRRLIAEVHPDLGGGVGCLRAVDIGDDDGCAVGGQHRGSRPADAATATGDDRDAIGEELGTHGRFNDHRAPPRFTG